MTRERARDAHQIQEHAYRGGCLETRAAMEHRIQRTANIPHEVANIQQDAGSLLDIADVIEASLTYAHKAVMTGFEMTDTVKKENGRRGELRLCRSEHNHAVAYMHLKFEESWNDWLRMLLLPKRGKKGIEIYPLNTLDWFYERNIHSHQEDVCKCHIRRIKHYLDTEINGIGWCFLKDFPFTPPAAIICAEDLLDVLRERLVSDHPKYHQSVKVYARTLVNLPSMMEDYARRVRSTINSITRRY